MTEEFQLLAQPWWVNLLVLIPIGGFWWWRTPGLRLPAWQLGLLTIWAAAFGFVEAAVVVYLRALVGGLLGYEPTFSGIARLSVDVANKPLVVLPRDVLLLETSREAATMIMLLTLALLVARAWKERSACFLWAFAVWDLCYYLGLRLTIRWPSSFTTPDILFLIPEPWVAQVWFPTLVSTLTLLAVLRSRLPDASLPSAS